VRVLRLPGFYHCKDKPFKVSIIHESGWQSYNKDKLIKAFPPYVNGVKKDKVIDSIKTNVDEKLVLELRSALNYLSTSIKTLIDGILLQITNWRVILMLIVLIGV